MDSYPSEWLSADAKEIDCLCMTDAEVVRQDPSLSACQKLIVDWYERTKRKEAFPSFREATDTPPLCRCGTGYLLEFDPGRYDFIYRKIAAGPSCYIRADMEGRYVGDLQATTGYALKSHYLKVLEHPR